MNENSHPPKKIKLKEVDIMGRPKKEKPNHATGMYEVKVTIGRTFDGKPIRKSFYSSVSKAAAKAKAEEYKINQAVALKTGEIFSDSKLLFKTWAIKWLETYKKGKVKDHTYEFTYEKNIEKYLIPYFGNARLIDIKQIDIQNYFNKVVNPKTKGKLSISTLDKQRVILKSIFDTAIDNDICYKNPVKNIVFNNVLTKKKRPVYTMEQAKKLEEFAIAQGKYDVILLLNTGMRRSELLGLKWTDIDYENKFIHIQRAVTQTTGKIVIDKTKSEQSNRFIPINDKIIDILNIMKNNCEYVISGESSNIPATPHSYADKFERFMTKVNKELGIPKLTPHELRHTYGTLLREKGVDIYTIQKVMGHSNIATTADIYVHNDLNVLRKKLKID